MANEFVPLNEAIGNFYPGKPMSRGPKGSYGGGKPIEFNDMNTAYKDFFKHLEDVVDPANLQKFNPIRITVLDSLKQSMTAVVEKPSKATRSDIPIEFQDDIDDIPGSVSVKLNLNPVDWVRDPKKQAEGFVNSLVKGTFGYDPKSRKWDFSDIDSTLEKDYVWDPLVKGETLGERGNQSFVDKIVASYTQNSLASLGRQEKGGGMGITDALSEGLVDYNKSQSFLKLGYGLISQPANPTSTFRDTFSAGMPYLKAESKREDTMTNISLSMLSLLDAQLVRDHDVSYVMGEDVSNLLNTRVVADRYGNVTRIADPLGNDALSATLKRSKDLQEEIKKSQQKVDNINVEISKIKTQLENTSDTAKKTQLNNQIEYLNKQVNIENNRADLSRKTLSYNVSELIGFNPVQSKELLQNFSQTLESLQLDPSNPQRENIVKFSEKLKEVSVRPDFDTLTLGSILNEQGLSQEQSRDMFKSLNDALQNSSIQKNFLENQILLDLSNSLGKQDLNIKIDELAKKFIPTDFSQNGLMQRISQVIDSSSLDPSKPENKQIIEFATQLKEASKGAAEFYKLLENNSLPESVVNFSNYIKNSASQSADPEFAFRLQNKAVQGIGSFSKELDELGSAKFKKNGYFGASELLQGRTPKEKAEGVNLLVGKAKDLIKKEQDSINEYRLLLQDNTQALEIFNKIISKHEKALSKMQLELDTKSFNEIGFHVFIKKQTSIYDTDTAGGGIKDVATRRFMEEVYLKDSEVSRALRERVDPDIFKRTKVMYLISRNTYENEVAKDWIKIFEAGPMALIERPIQRFIKERNPLGIRLDIGSRSFIQDNFLKPLGYFGLLHNDEAHEEFMNAKGLQGFLYRRIGLKLAQIFGVNNFDLNIDGSKLSIFGGAHLKGANILGSLVKAGILDIKKLNLFINAKDITDLDDVLRGLELPENNIKDLKADLAKVALFREWLKKDPNGIKVASFLGVTYDEEGNLIVNDRFATFLKKISQRAADPSLTDPTAYFVGALTKLSQSLSQIQSKFTNIIKFYRRPFAYIKALTTNFIANTLTAGLASATGPLAFFLRTLIRAVVQKFVDISSKFISAIFRFDLTEVLNAIDKLIYTSLRWLFFIILPFLLIIIIILDPVISLLSGVSPVVISDTSGGYLADGRDGNIDIDNCSVLEEKGDDPTKVMCKIYDSEKPIDWTPYRNGKNAFIQGFSTVINAAAAEYNIPAGILAGIIYSVGWSENVGGKFSETWNRDNVCRWSVPEGAVLPGCDTRRNGITGAAGSFDLIPSWFNQALNNYNVGSLIPLPRSTYSECNLLDASYVAAANIRQLADAIGINGCDSGWFEPIGSSRPEDYEDGLSSNDAKARWVILHYACGLGNTADEYCNRNDFLNLSRKGFEVFEALTSINVN